MEHQKEDWGSFRSNVPLLYTYISQPKLLDAVEAILGPDSHTKKQQQK
jgi:hypothetical protein